MNQKQPVMFVGGAGTGKTTLMNTYFSHTGEAQEDSRLLTNMALSFTNQMTFLSVHVSSGGETEEVHKFIISRRKPPRRKVPTTWK